MDFLKRRISRKTFGISAFLMIVIFAPLYSRVLTWDVQPKFLAMLCGLFVAYVLVRWRCNDIGISKLKAFGVFVLFCIWPLGIIALIYLLAKKGTPVELVDTRQENLQEQMERQEQQQFFELTERYRRYLKKDDVSHDAAIAQDFYTFCQGVPRLDKVVRQCHAGVSKFQDAYASLKRENILWQGGEYLPFLAFRDEKSLRVLLNDPTLSQDESLVQIKRILKQKIK